MHSSVYQKNIESLEKYHPILASKLNSLAADPLIQVQQSKSGHPVPLLRQKAIHSLEDPVAEAESIAQQIQSELYPQRLVFYGFGFGYHLVPIVRRGLSPIVIEPHLGLLKQALSEVDLSALFPHISLHDSNSPLPDIPRSTKVFFHPVLKELYPEKVHALSQKVIKDYPAKVSNIEEGVYYSTYRNVICLKNPCDLAVYQMILFLVRPTVILEIGTCRGGSALFFADLLRMMGGSRHVHTFDVVNEVAPEVLEDPNITFHSGGWKTFDPNVIKPSDRVLVIEDSAHTYENTIAVLRRFAPFVTANSYFIVEDGAAGLVRPEFNGGAVRAIDEFIAEHPEYEIDPRWENFFGNNSNCLKGFLRRKPI